MKTLLYSTTSGQKLYSLPLRGKLNLHRILSPSKETEIYQKQQTLYTIATVVNYFLFKVHRGGLQSISMAANEF